MRVAVVGLGLAGLRAARELAIAGVEPILFEARGRLGGRAYTIRRNNIVYDAGGEWIDADHDRVIQLCRRLNVALTRPPSSRQLRYPAGERAPARLWRRADRLARNLDPIPWRNRDHAEFDRQTLASWIDAAIETSEAKWFVNAYLRSDEGDDLDRIGLLGWLVAYRNTMDRDPDAMSVYRVADGMDRLVSGISKMLPKPQLNRPLRAVRDLGSKLELCFDGETAQVDRAILAIPAPALLNISFEPELQASKRQAIESCRFSRTIKVVWQFRSSWWTRSAIGFVKGPLQQLWDGGRGKAPILTAYVCGSDAVRIAQTEDPVRFALAELTKLYPQAADSFEEGWIHDWPSEPFTGGGFSLTAPGYVLGGMQHIATPVGRIHFAGEHTGTRAGFFEAALESGERAAGEVLCAAGR